MPQTAGVRTSCPDTWRHPRRSAGSATSSGPGRRASTTSATRSPATALSTAATWTASTVEASSAAATSGPTDRPAWNCTESRSSWRVGPAVPGHALTSASHAGPPMPPANGSTASSTATTMACTGDRSPDGEYAAAPAQATPSAASPEDTATQRRWPSRTASRAPSATPASEPTTPDTWYTNSTPTGSRSSPRAHSNATEAADAARLDTRANVQKTGKGTTREPSTADATRVVTPPARGCRVRVRPGRHGRSRTLRRRTTRPRPRPRAPAG